MLSGGWQVQYVCGDGWDFDGSTSLLLTSRILLRARSQPDDTSNCTSAQAKPPSPTSSTHSLLQHHRYPVDHSCVAAETRPQVHLRPKAKFFPNSRQRSLHKRPSLNQIDPNPYSKNIDCRTFFTESKQEHLHPPARAHSTPAIFLLPSQTGGVRSLRSHLSQTRQPVDLFCHHAERTVRCWNPAINSFPGLPPCAHDIDCDSNYPSM